MPFKNFTYGIKNEFRLLRHATLLIKMNNLNLLIDPMLADMGDMDPVSHAGNQLRIPTVRLPVSQFNLNIILDEIDAVFVTHTHRDHWDTAAQNLIRKNIPVFCQPADENIIKSQGFTQVNVVSRHTKFKGLKISRTEGWHGTGEIGKQMGEVSGFVLEDRQDTVYIAGDTIWCMEVHEALTHYKPNLTIVNSGAAQFLTGDPITMTAEDVINICQKFPQTRLAAVHMESVNHCLLSRSGLREAIDKKGFSERVLIPQDGELFR